MRIELVSSRLRSRGAVWCRVLDRKTVLENERVNERPRHTEHKLAGVALNRLNGDVAKDSVTIGRGGTTYPVDIKIVSSADVSREHARIRRDAQTGTFFLIDLSSLGTTLNGRHVPRGYDEVEGTKRENGVETPLPDQARIGLADMVYLEFGRL